MWKKGDAPPNAPHQHLFILDLKCLVKGVPTCAIGRCAWYSSRLTDDRLPGPCSACWRRAGRGVPDGNKIVKTSAPESSTSCKRRRQKSTYLEHYLLIPKYTQLPHPTHLNGDVACAAVYSDGIFPERQALFSHQDARLHGSAHRNDLIWGDGVQQLHVWEQISDHLLQLGNARRAST